MHRFFDPAGPADGSRKRRRRCCLPPCRTASAPRTRRLRGSIARPARTPTDASPPPSRTTTHGSGPPWVATPSMLELSHSFLHAGLSRRYPSDPPAPNPEHPAATKTPDRAHTKRNLDALPGNVLKTRQTTPIFRQPPTRAATSEPPGADYPVRTHGVRRRNASAWLLRRRCSRAGAAVGDKCDPQWRDRRAEQNAGRRRRDAHLAKCRSFRAVAGPGRTGRRRRPRGRLVATPFAGASKSGSSVSTGGSEACGWCWRSRRGLKSASSGPARNLIILPQGFWTNCRYVVGA